jgi:hypothetical protein
MKLHTHGLERTSPKGGPFVGRCVYCKQEGLPMSAALEPCLMAPKQETQILDALARPSEREPQ